jgi:hypothetical protein
VPETVPFFTDPASAAAKVHELRERGYLAAFESLPPVIDNKLDELRESLAAESETRP